jgi:putative endonuclease
LNIGQTGEMGESAALEYLKSKGYTPVTRNFYTKYGELDIVCKNDRYLVFAEVKTRANNSPYTGRESVTPQKQRKILKAAMLYMQKFPQPLQPRFDVIEVTVTGEKDVKIRHIENAFDGGVMRGFV